ncbi:hypothetical protein CK203_080027 [Vitis vinifera]|uniref:Serine aminopeptidase S33 domain-containing protein n=1 Tax=Vitis vinifera TaxID=29760 RepID=A0A438DDM6_VITVI|nr:hypothetical protein CK203_080027 [Vitis vinifera]
METLVKHPASLPIFLHYGLNSSARISPSNGLKALSNACEVNPHVITTARLLNRNRVDKRPGDEGIDDDGLIFLTVIPSVHQLSSVCWIWGLEKNVFAALNGILHISVFWAEYNPDQYLWEKDFTLAGRTYKRQDLEASMDNSYQNFTLTNGRGHTLHCSHYVPSPFPEDTPLPCVIYCHGNSGCRADANEAAVILLPSNITVFTLDFSGSGLSDGDYVSLGWHERDDLKVVVSHLRSNKQISRIGLWGRSMGAVTSLLYGAEDPSIAGMVLDSAFSNLFDLMMELVDVKMAVQYMRRVIQKKAKFDIMDLNCLQVAPKTFIPALFGHAIEDKFIQPHHSDIIFKSYSGDKNIIKFDGDHNSSRPQFYYDSVSIFFYNVLHPPQVSSVYPSKLDKYYDLGDLKIGAGMDETSEEELRSLGQLYGSFFSGVGVGQWREEYMRVLYEIIAGLRTAGTDAASSSSAPPSISSTKFVGEFLSEIAPVTSVSMLNEEISINGDDPLHFQGINHIVCVVLRGKINALFMLSAREKDQCIFHVVMQDKPNGQNDECCSYTSSNRESWGRCSSLGGSDEETSADCAAANNSHQVDQL